MDLKYRIAFKEGEEVESKCFMHGFRGAWFRCKIVNLYTWKEPPECSLQYFDYPDEKIKITRLYQKGPKKPMEPRAIRNRELMIRPPFPPFYRESQLPDHYPVAYLIAIVSDTWRVGDLVDMWWDGCYWSGKVSRLLGEDKVEVELWEPPFGEGGTYAAHIKDIRPSLDWSMENGWSVPVSESNGDTWYTARLVCTYDSEKITSTKSTDGKVAPIHSKPKLSANFGKNRSFFNEESSPCYELSNSTIDFSTEKSEPDDMLLPVFKIDSSVMELEELVNKISWLRGFLEHGFHWSNAMKPSWKFVQR